MAILVRFYQLDTLPGEWFGDISNVHEYVMEIIEGKSPFYYLQSAGPLYFYLISPIILFLGASFTGYKIASVIVGVLSLMAFYLLIKEIEGERAALVGSLIMGTSFWHLVWSRLGNLQIVTSLVVSLTFYFLFKAFKIQKSHYIFIGSFVSSLGLLIYPSVYILPIVSLMVMAFFLFLLKNRIKLFYFLVWFLAILPSLFIFMAIIMQNPDDFTSGYVGKKAKNLNKSTKELIAKTVNYGYKTTIMLHIKGDNIFRVNIPGKPQLDKVSGVLFILGCLYWLKKGKRKYLLVFIVSAVILVLPSILPSHPEGEVPNSGRVFSITPFVFIMVSSGILFLYNWIIKKLKPWGSVLLAGLLTTIVYLNIHQYFVEYPKVLPNRNVPFGKIISSFIDTLSENTYIYLTSCCWEEWGQPEPKAIFYTLSKSSSRKYIYINKFITNCSEVQQQPPFLIIFKPNDEDTINKFKQCNPGKYQIHKYKNEIIFSSLLVN